MQDLVRRSSGDGQLGQLSERSQNADSHLLVPSVMPSVRGFCTHTCPVVVSFSHSRGPPLMGVGLVGCTLGGGALQLRLTFGFRKALGSGDITCGRTGVE